MIPSYIREGRMSIYSTGVIDARARKKTLPLYLYGTNEKTPQMIETAAQT